MIKIKRYRCPQILENNPILASYYNNVEVTTALYDMQFGKCAYCEKSITDDRQVDHYIPLENFVTNVGPSGKKTYDWNKANNWNNLLYACTKCNGAKKKEHPFKNKSRRLIDPTIRSDPEKYLDFVITDKNSSDIKVTIVSKANYRIGSSTIKILKLSIRPDHLNPLKVLAIEFESLFLTLLVHIKSNRNVTHRDCQDIINDINKYMRSNSPYAGFARAFFRKRIEEYEQNEKPNIESELQHSLNLNIEIPSGICI